MTKQWANSLTGRWCFLAFSIFLNSCSNLIIEAVRRKRVPPEKEGMVHFAGFAALMVLMVVVMYNDIVKLF